MELKLPMVGLLAYNLQVMCVCWFAKWLAGGPIQACRIGIGYTGFLPPPPTPHTHTHGEYKRGPLHYQLTNVHCLDKQMKSQVKIS
jgi:hypothetical protein